jgi:oxygen-independent coproporphyrinogen-3 oxidase
MLMCLDKGMDNAVLDEDIPQDQEKKTIVPGRKKNYYLRMANEIGMDHFALETDSLYF